MQPASSLLQETFRSADQQRSGLPGGLWKVFPGAPFRPGAVVDGNIWRRRWQLSERERQHTCRDTCMTQGRIFFSALS